MTQNAKFYPTLVLTASTNHVKEASTVATESVDQHKLKVSDVTKKKQIFKEHIDSIIQIIDCKEHLQRNIEHFKFGTLPPGNLEIISLNNRFKLV